MRLLQTHVALIIKQICFENWFKFLNFFYHSKAIAVSSSCKNLKVTRIKFDGEI